MATYRKEKKIEPRRLELSLSPEDGSLLTSPLSTVLISATDGLYTDLYNMAEGELEVPATKAPTAAADSEQGGDDLNESNHAPNHGLKKERMSNLSFAQRRHELGWRLAQHGKALTHVAALTAASHSTEFATATRVSTKALQHARTAWVQADEAQDALYFFHAQLFPARQAPQDIYGALDMLKRGQWDDLPTDLQLIMDRYENSKEHDWSPQEVKERWQMAVRDKLIRGEVGYFKQHPPPMPSLWKVAINGGIVRLTHGTPKQLSSGDTKLIYPVEAHMTVLSTTVPAQWSLLSIEVRAQAKTGESNHQLDSTNRQRYDLHRLCAKAMAEEEALAKEQQDKDDKENECPSRPLHRLFEVAHNFSLSWQLEILNAQAQALKRGVWASSKSSLVVTPIEFFTDEENSTIGVVSISFWTVDDRYGTPSMGTLDSATAGDGEEKVNPPTSTKLSLSIRAVSGVGIKVSLSGGSEILMRAQPHTKETVEKLVDAASSPFALSASNALLAATVLCAEQRCHAMVEALQGNSEHRILPPWIHLRVERGSVAVAAQVRYNSQSPSCKPVVLFRLACDARTGTFVSTFCRSAKLLQLLSSNEPTASETVALRMVKLAKHRRRAAANVPSSGRFVKDAFEGLTRSMNILGTKVGVGGAWVNKDQHDKNSIMSSSSLRHRSIQNACKDVKASLMSCCGMAAVYGLSSLATGVATGIAAQADQ